MAGPNRRVPRGMKPTVENPGKILKRLIEYVSKFYGKRLVIVLILILVSVIANLQGTMFMKVLIDDYIEPMLESGSTDFGPLLHAIFRTAGFYLIGVLST